MHYSQCCLHYGAPVLSHDRASKSLRYHGLTPDNVETDVSNHRLTLHFDKLCYVMETCGQGTELGQVIRNNDDSLGLRSILSLKCLVAGVPDVAVFVATDQATIVGIEAIRAQLLASGNRHAHTTVSFNGSDATPMFSITSAASASQEVAAEASVPVESAELEKRALPAGPKAVRQPGNDNAVKTRGERQSPEQSTSKTAKVTAEEAIEHAEWAAIEKRWRLPPGMGKDLLDLWAGKV